MCTTVVICKAFKDIQAVPVTHALCTHDQSGRHIELCIRLITAASSMHDISKSYASAMPDWLTKAFFNPEFERHKINIGQCCDNDNVLSMHKMDDLHQLDFVEFRLKSKRDFDTAYQYGKSFMNHLRSLLALIQDFQTLLCNRSIFQLIIPHILFQ